MLQIRMGKMKAVLLSLCLGAGIVQGAMFPEKVSAESWSAAAATAYSGGAGTSANPFLIGTGAELAYLAKQVNTGNQYANTYFELTADIDLDGREWTPIGGTTPYFRGKFDGKGHVISHLTITTNAEEAGLFGKVQDAEIRNVGLEQVAVNIAETTLAGGLVGNMFNKTSGTLLENVYVTGSIATGINVHTGGLVGRSSGPAGGTIRRSYSTAAITAGLQGAKVGGLAGTLIDTNLENSYATGDLAGGGDKVRVGGLVGYTTTAIGGTSYWNRDAVHTWTRSWSDVPPAPVEEKLGVAFSTEASYPANANGAMTSADMKQDAFLAVMNGDSVSNGVWKWSAGQNGGYPVINGVGIGRGPTITTHPLPATVDEDGSTSFTVTATGAASYQWQVDEGTGFVDVGNTGPYDGATTSTLTVTGAAGDMNGYAYRAIARDISAYATASTTVTLTVNAKPAAPANVRAEAADRQVNLSWNPVPGATGYKVYQSVVSATYGAEAASVGASVYSAALDGLTNGIRYYFAITALNGSLESLYSQQVDATPAAAVLDTDSSEPTPSPTPSPSPSPVPTPRPTSQPAQEPVDTGVDVLVNGTAGKAGKATTSERNGQQVTTVTVDEEWVRHNLGEAGKGAVFAIPFQAGGDVAVGELNGQLVQNMADREAVIEIRTDRGSYTLPANQLNLEAIAERFGTKPTLQDIKVRIAVAAPSRETVSVVEDAANEGGFAIVAPPLDFRISAVFGEHTEEVSAFTSYVRRTIAIPEGVDPKRVTTGIVVDPDGTVRHVPTWVVERDGRLYAEIGSLTNSTYAVVASPAVFSDIAGHWAEAAISRMGSRLIVNGTGSGLFNPDRDVTRAEFAAMIVRGLGLAPQSGDSGFADVTEADWYFRAIRSAAAYRLIDGNGDGTFRPDDTITREQAVRIVANAMAVTGLAERLQGQLTDEALHPYLDAGQVSAWAASGFAASIEAGIVAGRSDGELAPKALLTRAEAAAIVERLLAQSGLIDR
ncbi:S-layer homology domain-containing protein [Paenibacillus cymbidii]|uniref:S-layer homology domain-containing protein n=1 Tax=Paenibacillus cymbidii TaxID=1639034 RepID=UPI0014367A44|nr:S-layer homology domain-containing protein [Paenibacillus cymbidii]